MTFHKVLDIIVVLACVGIGIHFIVADELYIAALAFFTGSNRAYLAGL